LQNAKNGFPQQFPSPMVHAGAVPPPNLPMPVGSTPDASFQALPLKASKGNPIPMSVSSVNASPQISRMPMQLNQSSLFQLSQYMQNGATIPVMLESIQSSQLQDLSQLISANSNTLSAIGMTPPGTASTAPTMSSAAPGSETSESKQEAQQGLKRSHGPSMDR
jgi:hypothetical protein